MSSFFCFRFDLGGVLRAGSLKYKSAFRPPVGGSPSGLFQGFPAKRLVGRMSGDRESERVYLRRACRRRHSRFSRTLTFATWREATVKSAFHTKYIKLKMKSPT
jgi:hypothetical protein